MAGKVEDIFCRFWVGGKCGGIKFFHQVVDYEMIVCLGCPRKREGEEEERGKTECVCEYEGIYIQFPFFSFHI